MSWKASSYEPWLTQMIALFAASAVSFVILGFPGNASGGDVDRIGGEWIAYSYGLIVWVRLAIPITCD